MKQNLFKPLVCLIRHGNDHVAIWKGGPRVDWVCRRCGRRWTDRRMQYL
jgi:hypothetical protein